MTNCNNDSVTTSWASRQQKLGVVGYSNGGDVEHLVALANESGLPLHVNIPPLATMDFVTNFATYMNANLASPDVVIEYGNEIWNFQLGNYGLVLNACLPEIKGAIGTTGVSRQITNMEVASNVLTITFTGFTPDYTVGESISATYNGQILATGNVAAVTSTTITVPTSGIANGTYYSGSSTWVMSNTSTSSLRVGPGVGIPISTISSSSTWAARFA